MFTQLEVRWNKISKPSSNVFILLFVAKLAFNPVRFYLVFKDKDPLVVFLTSYVSDFKAGQKVIRK